MTIFLITLWVRSITITGDSSVGEKELRSVMILKEPWFFKKTEFHPELLDGDIEAIRTVYLRHGFLNPEIRSSFKTDSARRVDIRIEIEEGPRTLVRSITFKGNRIFNTEDLKGVIKTEVGSPFNPLRLEEDYLEIISHYDEIGYHDASVTADVFLNPGADLIYQIDEGEKVIVQDLRFVTEKVMEERLWSLIPLRVGDSLTRRELKEARLRLYDTGVFSRVRIQEKSLNAGRGVVFDLTDRKPIRLGFKVGYSTLDGPKTTMTVEHRNLFRSLRRMEISGKLSFNELGSELGYQDPITLERYLQHGFGMGIKRRDEISYRISRIGGYGFVSPRPFLFRYDLERVKISEVDTPTTEWLRTLSINFELDHRDHLLRPKRGYLVKNRLEAAGVLPKAESNFLKDELLFRIFIPWKGSVAALRFDFGAGLPVYSSAEIPIYSRFFLGGATTIRGYGEDEVDTLGGERYLLFSFEERLKIIGPLGCVFFIDLGNLAQDLYEERLNLIGGIGFGLRFYTPLGPIRFDYGRNFEGGARFHFAIGEAF
ncbi:MAG TPA: hypothetical protein EYP24_04170 [bacterium (Candidatus Stahlbacteria)]|nr:hypothetical protein [Candidatus Stahlbacteria bacterium]